MTGKRIGYIRVSTAQQNTDRQLEGIAVDRTFLEKVSAKDANRPEFEEMMKFLRDGDTLIVHSMDRLCRNLEDLRRTIRELTSKKVKVQFIKENLIFTGDDSPMNMMLLNVMGAFAELERALMLERQREGIAIAKAAGKYRGGRPKLSNEQIADLKARVAQGVPKSRVAKDFKITRETVYQYLNKQK